MKNRILLTAVSLLFAGSALAVDPQVGTARGYGDSFQWIEPLGAQVGAEVDVQINGYRLTDAKEILWYSPGIEVLEISKAEDRKMQAKFRIAKDCRLGEHHFRVRTATGISQIRSFLVGPFPQVREQKEDNDEFAHAQKIELNSTIEGKIDNEDIDYYAIEAKQGQRISAEVEGIRNNTELFDAYVAVHSDDGAIIAESDDTALLRQDPALSVIAPKDGTYYIQVRETSYGGGRYSYYRTHIGTFPRPLSVYPTGGKAGEKIKVKFMGDAAGDFEQEIQLPANADETYAIAPVVDGVTAPSGNSFRVTTYGNLLEAEPNNVLTEATATTENLPLAFNGIIEKGGDIDCFKFPAKKGQRFHVRVHADAVDSSLDPVLNIYRADNNGRVTGNDDSGGRDSYVRFDVPEDGDYIVRVNDHRDRGGETFTYRVEFTNYEPTYSLSIPHVSRRDSQSRQAMAVPRGNRFQARMTVRRENGLRGDVKFVIPDLPKGVKLISSVMPGNISTYPLVFEAEPDAPLGAWLVTPQIVSIEDGKEVPVKGSYDHVVDLVHAEPNQTVYKAVTLNKLCVVVTEEAPFKMIVEQPKGPIAQYGDKKLNIRIEKKEGFDETVFVYLPFRSPGVSGHYRIAVSKGKDTAEYPINANYKADTGKWDVCVEGYAGVKGGDLWIASEMVSLEIVPRYVLGKFETTTVEQGQEVAVKCGLDQKEAFEGTATLTLYGLPPYATAEPVQITKDSKEAVFQVKTTDKTPVGAHKRLYTKITFPVNGEEVDHMVATSGRLIVAEPKAETAKEEEPKKVALAK